MEVKLNEDDFIVSKTDLEGKITYGNRTFIEMSGYSEKELLGAPHNILRHEDMPKIVFSLLWSRIQNKDSISAYVKNLRKDGKYYWVFANATASVDQDDNIVGYYSVRRKPTDSAVKAVEGLYEELLQVEKSEGVKASEQYLNTLLDEKGIGYDEFVLSLQK